MRNMTSPNETVRALLPANRTPSDHQSAKADLRPLLAAISIAGHLPGVTRRASLQPAKAGFVNLKAAISIATVLAALFLVCASPATRANDGPPPPVGTVVSVRGKIIQIQPLWLRGQIRLIFDDHTQISETEEIPVSKLPIGTRVMAYGRGDAKKGVMVRWLQVSQPGGQQFGRLVGIQTNGDFAYYGGKLKSVKPFVVTDDSGKDITALGLRVQTVHGSRPVAMKSLLIGRHISYQYDRVTGGIFHVTGLSLDPLPGKGGIIFATVQSLHGSQLSVIPRFGTDSVNVTLGKAVRIQRQIDINADNVHPGQTLSAWGAPIEAQRMGPLFIAYALMPGRQTFPAASGKPGSADSTITGKIVSLDPFLIQPKGKKPINLMIPGQTPLMTIGPASRATLRPGAMVMLMCTEGKDGALTANYILVDASPILGYA